MADSMGLAGMGGAAGAGNALQTLFEERMQAATAQRQQQQLDQNDALTRLKIQEQADAIRQRVEAQKQAETDRAAATKVAQQERQDRITANVAQLTPVGGDLGPTLGPQAKQLGFPVTQTPGAHVQQTAGFMPLPSAPPVGPGMQTISGLSPIGGPPPSGPQMALGASTTTDQASPLNVPETFRRGATQQDIEKQKADALAAAKPDAAVEAARLANENKMEFARLAARLRPEHPDHFSPVPQYDETGKPVGTMAFNTAHGTAAPMTGPDGKPLISRAAPGAAQAAQQTAKKTEALDTLSQLDQAIESAKGMIGPGSGRVSNIEQMIGNADPKIQALGTKMLIAKMKIDASIGGMRAAASPQLLARWDNLLANKVTPEGLHAATQALREIIGGTTAASAGKLSAADLIKKYGGGD